MITKKNYFEHIEKIGVDKLPIELSNVHNVIVSATGGGQNWDIIDKDKEFGNLAGLAFEKLEELNGQPLAGIVKGGRFHEEQKMIERFLDLHDKERTEEEIARFIDDLQKAIKAKKIRKTSVCAEEIELIQQKLLQVYNKMAPTVKLTLTKETLEKMEKALVVLKEARSQLKVDPVKNYIKETPLSGLPVAEQAKGNIMTSSDFVKLKFEKLGFKDEWLKLIGDPSPGFTAMVYGWPKIGKSYLCIDFAGYLARNHGKVLYVAVEEKLDDTLQIKLNETKVDHPDLIVSDFLPQDLSPYQFVFLDSVSKLKLKAEDLTNLETKYPKVSFIYIFQVRKDGKAAGSNSFKHDVDVVIEVPEKGRAVQYGRFNQGGEMQFFKTEEEIEEVNDLAGLGRTSVRKMKPQAYTYIIDLDERGGFLAHVESKRGKTVFEIKDGNELPEDTASFFDEGMVKHKHDIEGLQEYLRESGIIGEEDWIVEQQEIGGFKKSGSGILLTYIIDLDEKDSFKAHLVNPQGKSIYKIKDGNALDSDEISIIQEGAMKSRTDIKGLQKFLRSLNIIGTSDHIVMQGTNLKGIKNNDPTPFKKLPDYYVELTVSSGNVKTEVLLKRLLRFLDTIKKEAGIEQQLQEIQKSAEQATTDSQQKILDEQIKPLLDRISPAGTYFGNFPGNKMLFGFWKYDNDEVYLEGNSKMSRDLKRFNSLSDDANPRYTFSTCATECLTTILNKNVDLYYLLRRELANRGLDEKGKWVGFDKANKIHGIEKGDLSGTEYIEVKDAA